VAFEDQSCAPCAPVVISSVATLHFLQDWFSLPCGAAGRQQY
jgi:hypothetical protein